MPSILKSRSDANRNKILYKWIRTLGLYSPENNLMVVKILDAARKSAKTGKAVIFK